MSLAVKCKCGKECYPWYGGHGGSGPLVEHYKCECGHSFEAYFDRKTRERVNEDETPFKEA